MKSIDPCLNGQIYSFHPILQYRHPFSSVVGMFPKTDSNWILKMEHFNLSFQTVECRHMLKQKNIQANRIREKTFRKCQMYTYKKTKLQRITFIKTGKMRLNFSKLYIYLVLVSLFHHNSPNLLIPYILKTNGY